jgi:hypothetical protein
MKRTKAGGPVQRDAKEVLAEVLAKLTGKLEAPAVSTSVKEKHRANTVGPNRDRLTVGVDLACIIREVTRTTSQWCRVGYKSQWLGLVKRNNRGILVLGWRIAG